MTPSTSQLSQVDKLADMRWRLDTCIAANERARVNKAARWHLDRLSDRLRKYRVTLSVLEPEGAALWSGPNWQGPAIMDTIRESAFHRDHGKLEKAA